MRVCVFVCVFVSVCVYVCLFPPTIRLLLTEQNNECTARVQAYDVVLRK